jgi:hypothetical protein
MPMRITFDHAASGRIFVVIYTQKKKAGGFPNRESRNAPPESGGVARSAGVVPKVATVSIASSEPPPA